MDYMIPNGGLWQRNMIHPSLTLSVVVEEAVTVVENFTSAVLVLAAVGVLVVVGGSLGDAIVINGVGGVTPLLYIPRVKCSYLYVVHKLLESIRPFKTWDMQEEIVNVGNVV